MSNGSGDFLAKIQLVLSGKEQVVSGLKDTETTVTSMNKQIEASAATLAKQWGVGVTKTGKDIKDSMKGIGDEAKKGTPLIDQMTLALKRAAIVAPIWMALRATMQLVIKTVQDQVKFLIDLETAMARIQIVGKGTEEEYKNLQTTLVALAFTYGATAQEAADAAVIFAQQGRTVKETAELTRTAMLASKILGTDIKTAVDNMTAAVEGFKISISDSTSIVDKWINVEKNFAVTSKDLADATKVAGASAKQLDITINEFLGDVAAVVEVTRKSGSEAARGLSFIYARLLTSGKQTIEQIAKIPFYMDETGKATNTVTTQLRSVSDILGELASKWDSLTVAEKLQIATSLGSKRQMVVLNALMQNYTASVDARIAALTSAGQAENAWNIIQDTTATKLKQVGAAWNVLTTAIGDTSTFKTSLSIFEQLIISFTSLINYEKAYGAVYSREINQMMLTNETRLNQIKSLEELLAVREKLARAPMTEENVGRLKKVDDAIKSITDKESRIRVAIEVGDSEELKKSIENRLKELEMEKIRFNVSLEFEPKIAEIENKIISLKRKFQHVPEGVGGTEIRKQLITEEEKVKKLYQEQNEAIEEQYKIQKGQEIARKSIIEGIDEEETASSELTESEEERLAIEKELIKFKYNGLNTIEQQVEKEIELVNASKTLYDAHAKNLKLEDLHNKLLEVRLQKRDQELNKLADLSMKYEEANMLEKSRIRRAAELTTMNPEELATAYQNTVFDKRIIEEYWSSFSQEAQTAIAQTTDLFKELSAKLPEISVPTTINQALAEEKAQANSVTNNIVGAQTINVNVDAGGMSTSEEVIDLINKMIDEKLMTNESFINTFAKRIRPAL